LRPKPYTSFFAQREKLSVAVYEKGPKILVQGRGVEDFVKFVLEPEIFGEARLGYEEVHSPEMFEPHFGVDESGKGDFFGPLVIAGVFVDGKSARQLLDLGVQDSKRIGSDARIHALAKKFGGLRAREPTWLRSGRHVTTSSIRNSAISTVSSVGDTPSHRKSSVAKTGLSAIAL
jgi:Ribonuclease HIII